MTISCVSSWADGRGEPGTATAAAAAAVSPPLFFVLFLFVSSFFSAVVVVVVFSSSFKTFFTFAGFGRWKSHRNPASIRAPSFQYLGGGGCSRRARRRGASMGRGLFELVGASARPLGTGALMTEPRACEQSAVLSRDPEAF